MNFRDFVFWSKNYLFRKKAIAQYRDALNNQKESIDKIKEINWEKRKKIVVYAYENIPIYKEGDLTMQNR